MTAITSISSSPAAARLLRLGSTLLLSVLLGACGGGGGGSSAASSGNPGGGSQVLLSGVAATGDPLAAAAIVLKDQLGAKRTATAASDGSFSVDITGLTAPFVLQASSTDGKTVLYSAASKSVTTNIDPLTDLAVDAYYRALGSSAASAFAGINGNSLIPSQIELDNLAAAFDNVLGAALTKRSIAIPFNIFNTGFTANGIGVDSLLHDSQFSSGGFTITSNSLTIVDTIAASSGVIDFSNQTSDATSGAKTTSIVNVKVSSTTQQQQRDEAAAVDGIKSLWSNLLQVVSAKGANLAPADLSSYIDAKYLDRGTTADVFAVELAAFLNTLQQGQSLSFNSIGRIFSFDDPSGGPVTLTAEVDFNVKNTATGASFTFPFIKHFQEGFLHDGRPGLVYIKESDGSYKLYGDQTAAYTALYSSSNNYYAATGAASGTVFALSAFAPFATFPSLAAPTGVGTVSAITITSDQGALPNCVGNQPYALGGSSVSLTQAIGLNGFALTLNGEELFLGCNSQLLATTAAPEAGSKYAIAYTKADGKTVTSSAQIATQSSEAPSLSSINGESPTTFLANHHAQDVLTHSLSLSWSLPTTFAVDSINIACNTFDAFGNQFFLEPTYLAPTALSGASAVIPASLPTTGNPVVNVFCEANFIGPNGELLTAAFNVF